MKLSISVQSKERPFWQPRYYDFNVNTEEKRAEGPALDAIGSAGKVTFTPTDEQINSAAFGIIVGDARYTASGMPVSTIFDGSVAGGGLAEMKYGTSELSSSYQLRLQTYGSLVSGQPFTIYTNRPLNLTFSNYLENWGVAVEPFPSF
ncbi:MAG: hypothetical protein ABSB60_08125 [Terracidiphilus sp.]